MKQPVIILISTFSTQGCFLQLSFTPRTFQVVSPRQKNIFHPRVGKGNDNS